ncbi:thiol reductant ABC exporter subunit CydC [Moritella viscosa]|uniref:Cysteine ABC transporter, ATP-binding/permease protein n=2 Tax=Moritella viscosa TaxID=80854 RepID=A0A1L0C0T8_9GAMM|nr:thiol reductant ABC exporter subunit CydC [Moritella viscosa]SGZ12491.1 Cysteine ABC transporter, ATP-binding/permease protein [Moritella viscosa]SHO12874.1 Cysteine ABC transporter, ATP-binding/permease protein [Moritella viscosa]SHO12883.1 Cysteine ABC transporter, ATP-binding/permease protein [Moritella viscosa]SHO16783.1 Cysteine ABC transporter, ATP-binding/permease protein [Moritella viscosa]SHO18501.1 Cysteine ABC transporter, ATP-binding/permease protein [Moritella viscosa]
MNPLVRLMKLLKPQLPLMLLGTLLSIITVMANIGLLAISGWFITIMAIAGLSGVTANYFTPAAIIRFLAIVRTAGRYAERLLTHRATFNTLAALRYYFYTRLEPLLPYYRVNFKSADILARLQQDIDELDNFYLRVLLPALLAICSIPLVGWAVSFISSDLAFVIVGALILVGFVLPIFILLLSKKRAQQQTKLSSELKIELVDGMASMRELLVYQISQQYQKSINRVSENYHRAELQLHRLHALATALTFLAINATVLASLYLLVPLVQTGDLKPEFVASAALLILVCFETVINMPLACQILPKVHDSAARLFEIIDKPIPDLGGNRLVTTGPIKFNDLSFTYPDGHDCVLKDIDLTIQQGEKVAIIGASGAGKSTLVNLLMGFWPIPPSNNTPSSDMVGKLQPGITIDDIDLNELNTESLREHVALMSQNSHLFHATIGDNLRLANPKVTESQMRDVCQIVGLIDFIDELENGFSTWLGETGSGLSGGQKQRLCLAQVLLRNAKVLVLDEPTKGLDRHSERTIITNLFEQLEQSRQSLLLITHKPLMLQKMDKIIVMDEGTIVVQGDHKTLMETNDYYRKLLNYF